MGILDFLYPKHCVGCGKAGTYFCTTCIKAAKLHFPQVCPVCERASVDGVTHQRCKKNFVPDGLTSLWVYEGVPKKLVGKLKYKFVSEIAREVVPALAQRLAEMKENIPGSLTWREPGSVVVPIPLHWTRRNWRGFNHTEEIAKELASRNGWRVISLLGRKKMTAPQVGKTEKERKKNVEGVFRLKSNAPAFQQSSVLLFDDVWTTGATLLEATRVLKKSGFKKVWCLTLCR